QLRRRARSTLFPYTTLFRSIVRCVMVFRNQSPVSLVQFRKETIARERCMHAGKINAAYGGERLSINLGSAHHKYFILASAALKRSEEHTSELQSREKLVCRL